MKTAIASLTASQIATPTIVQGSPRNLTTNPVTAEVPYSATYDLAAAPSTASYLDIRDINRASPLVPGDLAVLSFDRTINVAINGMPDGGEFQLYIRKGNNQSDDINIALTASEDSSLTLSNMPMPSYRSVILLRSGVIKLTFKRIGGDVTIQAVPFAAGGAGGGASDLAVLIDALTVSPTISANDNIPLAHSDLGTPKIHFDPGPLLSDPLGFGYLIIQNNAQMDYRRTIGIGTETFYVIPSKELDELAGTSMNNNGLNAAANEGRALSLTDSLRREDLVGALLVRSDKEQIILLTNHDELRVDLKIRQGISEATISANHVLRPDGLAINYREVGEDTTNPARVIGGYVFNLSATQRDQLFQDRETVPVSHVEMHLVSLPSTTAGRTQQHLSIRIGDVWYEGLNNRVNTGKRVTGATLFSLIAEKAKPIVDAAAAALQRQIEAIQGGGEEAPFSMEMEGVSTSILTQEDIPGVGVSFNVLIHVNGIRDVPAENIVIRMNGSELTFVNGDADRTLVQGTNTFEVSIPAAAHGNILRNAGREINFQATKGDARTRILRIPLHEVASSIPERLRGISYLQSGFLSIDSVRGDELNISGAEGMVAFTEDGTSITRPAGTSLRYTQASDLPAAARTIGLALRSAGLTYNAVTNERPSDRVNAAEWDVRVGESDFYKDAVTVTYPANHIPAISTDPGGIQVGRTIPVVIGVGTAGRPENTECADATILSIDTRSRTIVMGLKRNAYIRGDAAVAIRGDVPQRVPISSINTFLLGARVFMSSTGFSLEFDAEAAVPNGSVHVGDVALWAGTSSIPFYRTRRHGGTQEFKNKVSFERVSNTQFRTGSDAQFSVNGRRHFSRRGAVVEASAADAVLSTLANNIYDVYWYASETDRPLTPSLVVPNRSEEGALVFPLHRGTNFGICVLKTRVSKSGAVGRETYAFISDYNPYPWQRFNSEAKIDKSIPFLFRIDKTDGADDEISIQGAPPFFIDISASDQTNKRVAMAVGAFRNIPALSSVNTVTWADRRLVHSISLLSGNVVRVAAFIATSAGSSTKFTGSSSAFRVGDFWSFVLTRTGDDARQVELDNRYSG